MQNNKASKANVLRVKARRRIFRLLNKPSHIFKEEIVHVLLIHVLELEAPGGVALGHGVSRVILIHFARGKFVHLRKTIFDCAQLRFAFLRTFYF